MSIIIVGGGMTGATLALAISRLTQGRLPVHLVEAVSPEKQGHPGFDARAIALAQGTCEQLVRLGIWPYIADYATAIRSVHVSDRQHAGFVTLTADDYQLPALGQVVELQTIGRHLFHLVRQAKGVTLHCPQRVTAVHRDISSVEVTLSDGHRLEGALLVAADGSRSTLAAECGITWQTDDYQQLAVIANVLTAEPHQGRAYERFTQEGPLAMLPMSDGRCSLVWCHALARRHDVESWDEATFCRKLQTAFGWRLGQILRTGTRHHYALALSRATSPISHRVVVVGNAAQTLHPIAGQGFNLAMRDALSLAETLARALASNTDLGSYAVLAAYQQQRQNDKDRTISLTDGLVKLFSGNACPQVALRNAGLVVLDNVKPARDALAQRTLGWVAR